MSKPKLYELTPEHRAQLQPWAEKWIQLAMSTQPMSLEERQLCVDAVYEMYRVSKLEPPKIVVGVSSPMTGAIVACVASGARYLNAEKNVPWSVLVPSIAVACSVAVRAAQHRLLTLEESPATWAATGDATGAATGAATEVATGAATWDATWAATRAATRVATGAATEVATEAATEAATWAATEAATWAATRAATSSPSAVSFLVSCLRHWNEFYNGGCHWAGYASYLSFFRWVANLQIEYSQWIPYETLAEHSAERFMHRDFVVISDRPEVLRVDDRNLPHSETGPSHRWRDGFELYHWHGVRVPAMWILDKASLTPQIALAETNAERRRAACEILGWKNILTQLNARVIDKDPDKFVGTLLEVDLPDSPGSRFLQVKCGTGREFVLPVSAECGTALEANAWTFNIDVTEFTKAETRT